MPTYPSKHPAARALLCLCATLAFIAPAFADSPPGAWIKTDKACEFSAWNPYPEEGEKIVWTGDCKDGVAHGAGTLQWTLNGTAINKDVGQAANGKWHGRVVSYLPGGIRYEGDFSFGRRVGLTRHIYSKAALESSKAQSASQAWVAEGYWAQDEFVLPMLYSRFAERRICPKAEQDRDLCVGQQHALLTAEKAALATLHQLGLCMNMAESLMEIYDEKKTPDPKQVRYYGQAFDRFAQVAKAKGLSAHTDDAQQDTQPALYASLQPIMASLQAKDKNDEEMDDAEARAVINALTPSFKKNCQAFLK